VKEIDPDPDAGQWLSLNGQSTARLSHGVANDRWARTLAAIAAFVNARGCRMLYTHFPPPP